MGKVQKSESLKGVKVPSLDLILDDIMENVPRGVFDLSTPEIRAQMRGWLQRIGRHLATEVAWEMADAAGRAVKESADLFINPRYYEDKKKRRDHRRATQKMKRVEEANAHRMIKAFGKSQFLQ